MATQTLTADAVDHSARGALRRLREDECELVAADAECVVSLAQGLLDRPREHLQGLVQRGLGLVQPVVGDQQADARHVIGGISLLVANHRLDEAQAALARRASSGRSRTRTSTATSRGSPTP